MTYETFKQTICRRIAALLPSGTSIHMKKIYKNNGLELDGLIITADNTNVSPTIFLNYYYEKKDLFPDFDAICIDILRTYEHNRSPENIDVDFFTDYRLVKPHLAYRIINFEKNKELLKTVPHICYLDLAIVFYCLLKITDKGNATILIHSDHLKLWDITVHELYQQTCLTTPSLLPYEFRNMSALLSDTFDHGHPLETAVDMEAGTYCPMYVLTNSNKLYGASCLLYPGLLEQIAQNLDHDLFILPSSIHELILLPTASCSHARQLTSLVTDINQTELSQDEVLSDRIYYYSRSSQQVTICPSL